MRNSEETAAGQKFHLRYLVPLALVIVGVGVADGRLVQMAEEIDWFFNSAPAAPAEDLAPSPAKPDDRVQIGPLDV